MTEIQAEAVKDLSPEIEPDDVDQVPEPDPADLVDWEADDDDEGEA